MDTPRLLAAGELASVWRGVLIRVDVGREPCPGPCLWSSASPKLRDIELSPSCGTWVCAGACPVGTECPGTSALRSSEVLVSQMENHEEAEDPRGREGPGLSLLGFTGVLKPQSHDNKHLSQMS